MTNSKQSVFGLVLAHLRTQKFDLVERKSWSQNRLAEESGLSVKIIGDIERGRRVKIDDDSLVRLANALHLNLIEREHFYALSNQVDATLLPPELDALQVLKQQAMLLKSMRIPAFIHDSLFNVVVANSLWTNLWAFTDNASLDPVLRTNLIAFYLAESDAPRQAFGNRWRQVLVRCITHFRAYSIGKRHTDLYQETLTALMKLPDFRYLWLESEQRGAEHLDSPFTLLQHGLLSKGLVAPMRKRIMTRDGNLYLTVILPGNEVALRQFDKMLRQGRATVHCFPPYENAV